MVPPLFIILSAIFIVYVGMGIIVPILPLYAAELGATGLFLGIIIAVFALTGGLLQPFVGGLSDRYGKKGFLMAGLFLFGVTGYTYTLAASVSDLIFIRILHGAGSAMILPMAMAYISELSVEKAGKHMGMLNIAIFAGIGGGPLLGGLFLDIWGRDSGFYAMGLLSILSAILVGAVLPRQKSKGVIQKKDSMTTVFGRMLKNRRVMGILLSRMATMIIIVPTFAFLPILMMRHMTASGTEIGLVIATRTLLSAFFQVPFGSLADRWNKNGLLFIGAMLVSFAMMAVPFAHSLSILLLLFALIGLGEAISWPALGALAAQEGPVYGHGAMMGIFNMAINLGLFIGAMGVGAVVDLLGIAWAFYMVSAFLFVSTIASCLMIRTSG
jgi:MFS transporter, DHA1 family, multidrug resistance protein